MRDEETSIYDTHIYLSLALMGAAVVYCSDAFICGEGGSTFVWVLDISPVNEFLQNAITCMCGVLICGRVISAHIAWDGSLCYLKPGRVIWQDWRGHG